jgi:acyl-CoA reductase-like NAD-dependent aldehyde dehydrogenase
MSETKAIDAPTGAPDEGESPAPAARRTTPRPASRLAVLKTYKLYIGGKFPRSESGRYDRINAVDGGTLANVCRASRKDFREAVVAARGAQPGWAGLSAYNRGQILYRAAEMLEGRQQQFVHELEQQGVAARAAAEEVSQSVDRLVYYAGWADKVQQIFSSVNPVASSHFNFSVLEPTGVVGIIAPDSPSLLGLVSTLAPVIAGGNTAVVLVSGEHPLCPITLAEVLHSSDLPGGVANLLSGRRYELVGQFATHMDLNAAVYAGDDARERERIQTEAALNVKRVVLYDRVDWRSEESQSPYFIRDCQEVKTTWHPIGS